MAVKACCIFAITDWNLPKRMPVLFLWLDQSWPRRIVSNFFCFFFSSQRVLSLPLKSKPRKIFHNDSWLLPFLIFLSEIGSFSLLLLVGKQSWIPCNVAVAICSIISIVIGITISMKSWLVLSLSIFIVGNDSKVLLPVTYLVNLHASKEPTAVSQYWVVTLRLVSVVAQKNGGDSTHPICKANGITRTTGMPGGCGSTW